LLACDTPEALKARIGGDVITMTSRQPQETVRLLRERLDIEPTQVDSVLRLERNRGHEFVPQIIEAAPGMIDSISVGRPTLEDVFVRLTGKTFRDEDGPSA
jgi:ABC-2 type transport system ATP-binding protein